MFYLTMHSTHFNTVIWRGCRERESHTLLRVVESKDVVFSDNDAGSRFQHGGLGNLSSIDVTQSVFKRNYGHHT